MKNYYIIIKSLDSAVKVSSSYANWIEELKNSEFLKRYIPCYEILDKYKKYGSELVLKHGKPKFTLKFPNATYSNLKYDEKDAVSIVELLLERLRQENGYYCMHSSSVTIRNSGVIIWGWASGLGKTRLILNLVKDFGAKFFSDEKTLIDLKNNLMMGGVRQADFSKNYFKNVHKSKKMLDSTTNCKPTELAFLVYPQVSESKEIFIEKWSAEKLDWHLYEELSRKIRATSRRLFNNELPVSPLDTPVLSKKRSVAIKSFVQHMPCYYICGTEKQISGKIIELVGKKT
ncbi:MAG: hypothetical protein COU51_03050 [Parcubacteria group bacterium CG10_big_fil_rev_8_21_14_0_10_36_14]|nr:MAG: hypothetical protein COU51_03050 [Parcubacteria group bacterium CG10_big_fil_rev_8_21_14_0_10_36_14]